MSINNCPIPIIIPQIYLYVILIVLAYEWVNFRQREILTIFVYFPHPFPLFYLNIAI